MYEQLKDARRMGIEPIEKRSSLTCSRCGTTAVPLSVESQTDTTMVLALRCKTCAIDWTTEADLPVFLARIKPDRRQKIRPGGAVCIQRPS